MRKNATKLAAAVLSLAMVMTSVNMPASAAKTKVKLNKTKATLYVNGSASEKATTLKVTVNGKKVNATFKSSNTKVLTVAKSGKVTAKKNGTAKVTATYKKKKYNCTVTVKTYATSVSITSAKTLNLAAGKTATIKATVKPSTASNKKVSFTSSKKNVATVTSAGKVTAKKAGTATVTVKALGSKKAAKKATVKVNVKAAVKPSTEPTTTPTTEPTATPETPVATEGAITVTTNVTGAAVKVVSGTAVKAEATAAASESAVTTKKVANGTYTVVVSKEGYKEKTVEVSVNGDTEVSVELEKYAKATEIKAKAVGAKKIQLTADAPLADTAKVVVKRGIVTVDTEKPVISNDKMTIDVETSGKLISGDYTITVKDASDKDLTATLKAEDEKVAKIEVTSKTAPYETKADTQNGGAIVADQKNVTAYYKVLNQYGEDITSANVSDITWSSASGLKVAPVPGKAGKILLTSNDNLLPGAKIYVTAVHAKTGTVTNAEMTVGVLAKADSVTFKGVYNVKTGKYENLPANFDNGTYVLLYEVADQFGNNLDASESLNDDLVFTSTNPLFVALGTSYVKDISDKNYMALPLVKTDLSSNGGTANIQVISKYTGKTASYEIKSDAAAQVKTFKLSAPEKIVAEGESVNIPFTALDQNGNYVTKYSDLVGKVTLSTPAGTGNSCELKEKADGTAKIVFTAAASTAATDTTDAPVSVTSLVKNGGNFSSLVVNVKKAAKPVAIKGLKDVATKILNENTATIKVGNILVQDQYGRVMSEKDVKTWLGKSHNKILVKSDDASSSAFKVNLDGEDDNGSIEFTKDTSVDADKAITLTPQNVDGENAKVSEKLTFSLEKVNAEGNGSVAVEGSEKEITFTRVGQSEFTSYVVDDLGTMFNDGKAATADSNHNKTVKVYGVRSDGSKVELKNTSDKTYYKVTVAPGVKLDETTNGTIADLSTGGYAESDFKDKDGKTVTKTVKVNVAIYDIKTDGEITTITKDLVLSTEAPKATTVTFKDVVKDGQTEITPSKDGAVTKEQLTGVIDKVKDQYDVDYGSNVTEKITSISISNISKNRKNSEIKVTTNGSETTALTGVEKGDKFTVTIHYGDKAVSYAVIALDRADA